MKNEIKTFRSCLFCILICFTKINLMQMIDKMWFDLPNDRASTPIKKRCSFNGPRTSTPKLTTISKCSYYRSRKKKKQILNNDYRHIVYGQKKKVIQNKKHSIIQIWFL